MYMSKQQKKKKRTIQLLVWLCYPAPLWLGHFSNVFCACTHRHTHTHTLRQSHSQHNTLTCPSPHTQIAVQDESLQQSTWKKLPDVPYSCSAVCVADGVLLDIGGSKACSIYALHPFEQRWQYVGNMPFECSYVDTLPLSGGGLLVVDGDSQRVLRVTVEGKSCK